MWLSLEEWLVGRIRSVDDSYFFKIYFLLYEKHVVLLRKMTFNISFMTFQLFLNYMCFRKDLTAGHQPE